MPRPLQVFTSEIAEVLAQSSSRAFVLDGDLQVRFVEDGVEKKSPIEFSMPGIALEVAAPQVHRALDDNEAKHTRARIRQSPLIAKREGAPVERAMFWKGPAYHDLARLGAVVLWRYGMNNAFNEKIRVCRASSDDEASAFLADFVARPPKGFKATSPYYVAGKGAVIRTFVKGQKRELRGVVDAEVRQYGGRVVKKYPSAAKAEAAFNAWVHKACCDGYTELGIEIDKRNKSTRRAES